VNQIKQLIEKNDLFMNDLTLILFSWTFTYKC